MEYAGIELVRDGQRWYFQDDNLSNNHDPKGHNEEKMIAWMQKNGLAFSDARKCLGKVLYGRAHTCRRMHGLYKKDKPICAIREEKRSEWFDHDVIFWHNETRQYVLTTQPYDVSLYDFKQMQLFAYENDLQVSISMINAWHYPGRTPLIVWRKA